MEVARKNRWGLRDATMLLVAYRHGLRPAELVDLRWDQADFRTATLHVRRVKRGTASSHPILGDELRARDAFSGSRSPSRRSCSPQNEAPHSRRLGSPAWLSGQALKPSSVLKRTRTCSGTLAATRWPTEGTTRERYRLTSGTGTFNTQCATPSYRQPGSKTSGDSSRERAFQSGSNGRGKLNDTHVCGRRAGVRSAARSAGVEHRAGSSDRCRHHCTNTWSLTKKSRKT